MPRPAPKDRHDETVNPKHYASIGPYAANIILRRWTAWRVGMGLEPMSTSVGHAMKYIQRAGTKPDTPEIVDLKKAIWYLQERIHLLDPANEPDPAGID